MTTVQIRLGVDFWREAQEIKDAIRRHEAGEEVRDVVITVESADLLAHLLTYMENHLPTSAGMGDTLVSIRYEPGDPWPDEFLRNWEHIPKMTEEEIHAAALADPDAQPLPEDLAGLRPLVNVKRLREGLGVSQEEFAQIYGIPLGTLRDWEQRRKNPDRTARTYLQVIAADPQAVAALLKVVV